MIDNPSLTKIQGLHPKIKNEVQYLIDKINSSILTGSSKIRIVQGTRTFAEQDALYAQGRNGDKRPKVTNAKGGQSIHNYGLAIDFALLIDGKDISWDVKKDWDTDKQSDWMEVVSEFKKAGYSWGGDWRTFTDLPHFEKTFGLSLKDLQSKYNKKDFIAGTTFVNI